MLARLTDVDAGGAIYMSREQPAIPDLSQPAD
jgi:hypothetical protein